MSDTRTILKDAAYIAVGFGVLGFQRAQVARQDLLKQARRNELESVLDDVENQIDRVLDEVEDRLPDPARELFRTARETAKDASGQLRQLARATRSNGRRAAA